VLGDEALRAGEGVPLGVEGWGEMSRQRHGVSRALLAVEGTKGNKSSPLQWGQILCWSLAWGSCSVMEGQWQGPESLLEDGGTGAEG